MSACFIKRDRKVWIQMKEEMGMNGRNEGRQETVTRIYFMKNIYFQLKQLCKIILSNFRHLWIPQKKPRDSFLLNFIN